MLARHSHRYSDNRGAAQAGFPVAGNATRKLALTASLALSAGQRREVFALRHASYLAGGFIDNRPGRLFSDPYDDRPNCQSCMVYHHGRPVASVRVCVLDLDPHRPDWRDIPALHVFPDEIRETMAACAPAALPGCGAVARHGRAIEINRLVRHPDFAGDADLVFVLFHLAGAMILRHRADIVFSCVRQHHIPFYRRLKFSPVAGPRSYPELKFATTLLACPSGSYQEVRRMMPGLETQVPAAEFSNLMEGKTVAVFGRA